METMNEPTQEQIQEAITLLFLHDWAWTREDVAKQHIAAVARLRSEIDVWKQSAEAHRNQHQHFSKKCERLNDDILRRDREIAALKERLMESRQDDE
jgi:hypothetical protein